MENLVSLLKDKEIDVLMLQEVRDQSTVLALKGDCGFSYYYWKEYFDCKEGLAILSSYPLTNMWTNWDGNEDVHNSGSMAVTIETAGRFDWIMLENPYPKPYPRLIDYQIIGKDIIDDITPSDHYGVVVEVVFK